MAAVAGYVAADVGPEALRGRLAGLGLRGVGGIEGWKMGVGGGGGGIWKGQVLAGRNMEVFPYLCATRVRDCEYDCWYCCE